ncbi:hypothetical protein BG005_004849, partial [Podila minutissima]
MDSQDTTPQSPHPEFVEWTFLDSPGLDDTDHGDSLFATDFASDILATQTFNLILVTVSTKRPITLEYKCALEYYGKVLRGHPHVAFLYTHEDYADHHDSNKKYHSRMFSKRVMYSRIFKGLGCGESTNNNNNNNNNNNTTMDVEFIIDSNSMKRPAVQCLIHNTLRDMIQYAVSNECPKELDLGMIKAIPPPGQAIQAHRDKCRASSSALKMGIVLTSQTETKEAADTTVAEETEKAIAIGDQAISPHDQSTHSYQDHRRVSPALQVDIASKQQTESGVATKTYNVL